MWKHIPYSELPSWLKKDWHPNNNRIGKKLVKVHHSEKISYKILYTRDRRGKIHTKCWKRYNTRISRKTTNNGLVAVGILVFCFLGFILVSQSNIVTDLFQEINRNIIPQIETGFPVITSSSDPYTGKYNVGNIATENSGTKGMAIVSNNYQGQYLVKTVSLESSGKGWYTKGSTEAQWVSYDEVEVKYPIKWGGGIMDTSHIPDRDWTITSQPTPTSGSTSLIKYSSIPTPPTYSPPPSYSPPASISVSTGEIEQAIYRLTNVERTKAGLSPLNWNSQLAIIAREHSQDMANNNFFSHTNLHGEGPDERATRHGYSIRKPLGGGSYMVGIGENIGKMPTGNVIGVGSVSATVESIAQAQVQSWMNSPGHRSNILDTQYGVIGVGVAYDGDLYYISTQDFQ